MTRSLDRKSFQKRIEPQHTETDQQLVARCKEGHRAAFDQLMRRYYDRIFSGVIGKVQNEAIAKDITQDVFLRVFEKIDQFHGDSSFSSWIGRIAINEVYTFFRKDKSHREICLDDPNSHALGQIVENLPDTDYTDPYDRLADAESLQQVQKIWGRIAAVDQEIFNLYSGGMDLKDISALKGQRPSWAKVRMHRARQQAKAELAALNKDRDQSLGTVTKKKPATEHTAQDQTIV